MRSRILKIFVNILSAAVILIVFDWLLVARFHYNAFSLFERVLSAPDRLEQNLPYNKKKRPAVTIGCSFVYGFNITPEETLAYKLQKLTKRKTYNLGLNASGIQHVLYKLQYMDFFDSINPKYVIYVFITDHIRRMYADYFELYTAEKYLKYEMKDGSFEPVSPDISLFDYIKASYTAKKINRLLFSLKSDDEKFNLLKLYLIECRKTVKETYPDAEFAVIVYNSELDTHGSTPFKTSRWKEIEEEGITVINFDTDEYKFLNEDEYKTEDKQHPSGRAWDVLAPVIAEKLKL